VEDFSDVGEGIVFHATAPIVSCVDGNSFIAREGKVSQLRAFAKHWC
jgi:hypothetical protein